MRTILFLFAVLIFPMSIIAQSRNDAGLRGDAGAVSGFFDADAPVNFPAIATSWWHLLDVRHSNTVNNFAMQFSGSFFDQHLFFRKTNNNASQPWSKVLLEIDGKVGVGIDNPQFKFQVQKNSSEPAIMIGGGYTGSPRLQVYGLDLDPLAWMGLGTDMNGGPYEHSIYFPTGPSIARGKLTIGDYDGTTYNPKMTVLQNGNVGIGTTDPKGYKLAVAGRMIAESVKVQLQGSWSDFVFAKDYDLPSLQETEKYIKDNGHLPGIPSATEVKANGIDLEDMNAKLLQKIEELTLYLIDMDNKLKLVQQENTEMKSQLSKLARQ